MSKIEVFYQEKLKMELFANVFWFIFGGLFWCIADFLAGILACVTIIGIPIGLQLFKMAGFVLWPFGKQVEAVSTNGLKGILNFVWAILFGWEMALGYCLTGILYCITVIGIPFGRQFFKIAHFVLMPLGRTFR